MLVLLNASAGLSSAEELGTQWTQKDSASLYTSALPLISLLYYTHAPQLPHASPPTRAPHI